MCKPLVKLIIQVKKWEENKILQTGHTKTVQSQNLQKEHVCTLTAGHIANLCLELGMFMNFHDKNLH